MIFPNFQVTNGEGRGLGTFYHICENTVSSDAPLNLGQCTEARMDDLMRTHYSYFAPGDFSPELVRFRQQLFHRQFCSAGADACNRATVRSQEVRLSCEVVFALPGLCTVLAIFGADSLRNQTTTNCQRDGVLVRLVCGCVQAGVRVPLALDDVDRAGGSHSAWPDCVL